MWGSIAARVGGNISLSKFFYRNEDPETWNALKSGGFVVANLEIPFTHMFTDQALEQEIKMLKGQGGMVGHIRSRDEGALDCLVTTVPHLAALVDQYLDRFPKNLRSSARKEHYQLKGRIAVRSRTISQKLQHLIEFALWMQSIQRKNSVEKSGIISRCLKRGQK